MSVKRNIRIDANATYILSVRWLDSAGTPYDLDSAIMQVRSSETSSVILEASSGNGLITLGTEGWAYVMIPPEAMTGITETSSGVYDIVVTRSSDSASKRLLEGAAVLSYGVSR